MATIELHDERGGVKRIKFSREKPIWFGTDPSKCEILLKGAGVAPIHGRLRWKEPQFRLESVPETPAISVNGRPSSSAKLNQGDEIAVGDYRIFLIDVSDPANAPVPPPAAKPPAPPKPTTAQAPAPKPKPAPAPAPVARPATFEDMGFADDDQPPVKPAPKAAAPPPPVPKSAPPKPQVQRPAPSLKKERISEDANFFEDAGELTSSSSTHPYGEGFPGQRIAAPEPRWKQWFGFLKKQPNAAADKPQFDFSTINQKHGIGHWLLHGRSAPGEEQLWTSPLVFILAATLMLLIALGVVLRSWIVVRETEKRYKIAMDNFDSKQYRQAISDFDRFLEYAPKDNRIPKATILQSLSKVRQHTVGEAPSWTNAVQAANEMKTKCADYRDYQDFKMQLGLEVRNAAVGLSERTKRTGKAEDLAEAEDAIRLHENITGRAAARQQIKSSRLAAALAQAKAAVIKSAYRKEMLDAMDNAVKTNKPLVTYTTRDTLVRRYPDLAADRMVVQRLEQANEQLRLSVKHDKTKTAASTVVHEEPLGPPLSIVLRDRVGPNATAPQPAAAPAPAGSADAAAAAVYALADGFAYGLDSAAGSPLWHRPVGLSSPFPPMEVPGSPGSPRSVLVFDARYEELLRLEGRTGKLIWRQPLKSPITSKPLLLGNQLAQATPGGDLIFLDLIGGEIQGRLALGRSLGQTPAGDESGQYLYLMADQANLYIISRDPPEAKAVLYIGHAPSSIPCEPVRIGPYLVVSENHALDKSRWHIFAIESNGAKLRPVQKVEHEGWSWTPPAGAGAVIWSCGDRGGVRAFSVGPTNEKEPFKVIASLASDRRQTGPSYAKARTERDLLMSSLWTGMHEVNIESKVIKPAWNLTAPIGPALGPIQMTEELAIFTQREPNGGVGMWGVEAKGGKPRWHTILGTRWPAQLQLASDAKGLVTLAPDGKPVTLPWGQLVNGGFVELPTPPDPARIPPEKRLPLGPWKLIATQNPLIGIPESLGYALIIGDANNQTRPVPLPFAMNTDPVLWKNDLLLAGTEGRVSLIDPNNGLPKALPLLIPYNRENPLEWMNPVVLDDNAVILADRAGNLRKVIRTGAGENLSLKVDVSQAIGAPLASDPATTSQSVIIVTNDNKIHSRAARDLGPQGVLPMEAPLALGPFSAGDHVFLADIRGGVIAYNPNGTRSWSVNLKSLPPIGRPVIFGQELWLLGRDGILHRRSLSSGEALEQRELKTTPAGSPWALTDGLVVPVAPGTTRALPLNTNKTTAALAP